MAEASDLRGRLNFVEWKLGEKKKTERNKSSLNIMNRPKQPHFEGSWQISLMEE